MKHLTETPPDLPASVSWPIPEPHALRSTETLQSHNKHRKKNPNIASSTWAEGGNMGDRTGKALQLEACVEK